MKTKNQGDGFLSMAHLAPGCRLGPCSTEDRKVPWVATRWTPDSGSHPASHSPNGIRQETCISESQVLQLLKDGGAVWVWVHPPDLSLITSHQWKGCVVTAFFSPHHVLSFFQTHTQLSFDQQESQLTKTLWLPIAVPIHCTFHLRQGRQI